MILYGEINLISELRTQLDFKNKRGHITKTSKPNIAYPYQHSDIEIPYGSRDHAIVPDTLKTTFNFDIEYTDKTRSVAKNIGRTLLKKKVLMFGSKGIHTSNNTDIYDTHKEL